MIDFVEATLTLEGCGYEGQSHNADLVIKNVATTPDQYCIEFDYLCKWFVDETNQETLFAGAYSGDPMAPGDNVTYSMVWTPTIIGVGVFKMNVIDIVWVMPEPITWTTDIVNNVPSKVEVLNFLVTGASKTYAESGTANFDIHNVAAGAETISYVVEIVELSQTVGSATGEVIPMGETRSYSHDFDPLTVSGSYTMRITVNS